MSLLIDILSYFFISIIIAGAFYFIGIVVYSVVIDALNAIEEEEENKENDKLC